MAVTAVTTYTMNAGLAPLNPQAVTVATGVNVTGLSFGDVTVSIATTGNTGTINKMQVRLILENILALIEGRGVGTGYQTDDVPTINP